MQLGHTIEDSRAKYPELTVELLNELRAWSEENGVSGIPDAQLGIFAHSCYFNVEATKNCMSAYYRSRSSMPEFFANRDPRQESVQRACKTCAFFILQEPDNNGNTIMVHRLLDYRPSAYVMNDAIKLLTMMMDAALYDEGCTSGYTFVFDMTGVKLGHIARVSISSVRKFFDYVQNGLPVRLKAIHVINCVWFIDKILAIVKPFMNRELFDLMHLYTGDVSQVCEHVSPRCFPKDLGGEIETSAALNAKQWAKIDQLRDYFREEERLSRGWGGNGDRRRSSTVSSGGETKNREPDETTLDEDALKH